MRFAGGELYGGSLRVAKDASEAREAGYSVLVKTEKMLSDV